MKKIFFLIVTLSIVLFSVNTILGQKAKPKLKRAAFLCEDLNLTDVQKDKFDKIRFAHEESKIEIESLLKKNRLEIKKLMSSNEISESDLMNLVDNGSKLKADMQKNRVKMWFSVYNILDESQKEIWKTKFENFGKARKDFLKKDRIKGKKNLNRK